MAILHTLRALGYLAMNRVQNLRRTPKHLVDPRFATTHVYIGFRMMDMFGHVNNARYLEIAEFARWRSLWGIGGLVNPSKRHKTFQLTESKTDRATGERKKVSRVAKSRAPYAFVVASAHLQYARPMSCFQFAKVECALVGMTPGQRGLWMMQRIYDSKDRLCCQVYFRASMIDFKTGKGVSLKEAYAMSEMGDRLLELDRQHHIAQKGDKAATTHADTAEYAAMTPEQKLDADFSAMCRRAFIFGDTELSREALEAAAPGVMRHHPYVAMYDEAEQSERKSIRGVVPTKAVDGKSAADVFRSELESAIVVRPPRSSSSSRSTGTAAEGPKH